MKEKIKIQRYGNLIITQVLLGNTIISTQIQYV